MELDDGLYKKIKRLCSEGDDLAEEKSYSKALTKCSRAYDLIPNPITDWNATTWILAAIGDVNFLMGNFKEGRKVLLFVMRCPKPIYTYEVRPMSI